MYNNPYLQNYNPQDSINRINNQIAELEKMKAQLPTAAQPTNINQTFQLSPNHQGGMRYANSINDVNKEFVVSDTPFFSKDLSIMWIKNPKGEIKSYEVNEIVQKDEKDIMIESLQLQLDEMKEVIDNVRTNNDNDDEPIKSKKSPSISKNRTVKKK